MKLTASQKKMPVCLLDNDEFLAIESYSAEFKIVVDALNNSSKIENSVISPVILSAGNDIAKDFEYAKSWWQFWK